MPELEITTVNVADLMPYAGNAKEHPAMQVDQIAASIEKFGNCDPIGVWHNDAGELEVVEGHGRLMALNKLGIETAPVIFLDHLTDEQRRAYALVHNQLTMNSDFDTEMLEMELDAIIGIDMSDFGFEIELDDADDFEPAEQDGRSLVERFVVPPFSVLDTRQGYWKDRKQWWNDQIGDTGQARDNVDLLSISRMEPTKYNSASILDPVLSELVCRWFSPANGNHFDTFAGDTVFGYVSASLGNSFTGIELRQEQCDFNANATSGMPARYICDDGCNVLQHLQPNSQDLYFSCPPYYDLEVYSDLDRDASNQGTYEEFYAILDTAFERAVQCLKENRFAVIVAGDVRNHSNGAYYDFISDIKATFKRCGCLLYNELILVEPVGTARLRAAGYMRSRKVAKVHQSVLVFYKGDTRQIPSNFPEVELDYEGDDLELEALD